VILPSKKVLSIFILTAALVVAIIITFGRDKSSQVINSVNNLVAGEKVSIPENPNWQNELGGIAQNTKSTQTEESSTTKETTTDTISKTLMSNYQALKQSGTLDAVSAQKLVDQTVNYVDRASGQIVEITKLNVVADNGKQSITDYGENLGNIFRNNKSRDAKNELEIINQALTSKDASKMDELDSIIAVYDKTTNELIKMPVPKTFVKAHLDIVNGANAMVSALKEIKNIFNDPIKGLSALQLYQAGITTSSQALKATKDFIIQNKIIYKQGSGGYYLLYGI
jgi:hypothetical protein